jgi:outer membrane protein TolC
MLLTVLSAAILAVNSAGQVGPTSVYTNGRSPYPDPAAPFSAFNVPKPSFTNSVRLTQVLRDGKLMLSLDDAIALALENNLDLAIARYNLPIADTDILRTKSGASPAGVNTGIVQGTPGGTALAVSAASGSGAGGTSLAAGGAGTGIGGLVTSSLGAGPPVDTFDPLLTLGLSAQHAATPLAAATAINAVTSAGLPFQEQNTGAANFGYQQAFPTGTLFNVAFNNNRVTTAISKVYLTPSLTAAPLFSFRQHLLQGFGIAPNNRFIRIAKNNREISDVAFRLQVTTTVTQIENIYWNLVNASEDVKAKQRALDLANRLLTDNQKQVKIGTLAPIEVVRAQSQVASASQDLLVSQTNLQLQQLLMKNAISRNLVDPQLMAAEVLPTDTMQVPAVEPVVPTEDLIAEALSHRAELAVANIDLTNRGINTRAAKNALLPTLDLVGSYGTTGMGGVPTTLAPNAPTTGFGDALSSAFSNDFPTYTVGFNLNIPIRNRAAQAIQIRSQLEYRQAQMRVQQLENQIRIEVRNAQIGVQQNRARVEAARKGRQLAYETMDAEQKKYALGASTTYNVLQTQQALSAAESNLITATAAYEQSKVEMDRATGLTLANLGIQLVEAQSGNVQHLPHVPGVVPASTATPSPASPQGTVPTGPQAVPSPASQP